MPNKAFPKTKCFFSALILWACGGYIFATICVHSSVPLETINGNQALAAQINNVLAVAMWKVAALWAIVGGIIGISMSKIYQSRPGNEYYTAAPSFSGASGMSSTKMLAETNTTAITIIFAIIYSLIISIFLVPTMQGGQIVVAKLFIRIVSGIGAAIFATAPIMPFVMSGKK